MKRRIWSILLKAIIAAATAVAGALGLNACCLE